MRNLSLAMAGAMSCFIATVTLAAEDVKHVDPSGTWRWQYDWEGQTMKDSLQLNLDEDGKLTGTFQGRNDPVEVEEAKIEGDKLWLTFPVEFDGTEVVLTFSGTIKEDEIDGEVVAEAEGETYEFPWRPQRSVEMEDVVGTWHIRIETPNGNVLTPTLKIAKQGEEYTSGYTSMLGDDLEVKDLRVAKNNLMFTVQAEFEGNRLTADYQGRPYGDKIKGKLAYEVAGDTGELEFVARRPSQDKSKK